MSNATIKRGDHGDQVSQLQQLLVDAGYGTLAVDGSFGPGTAEIVREFQGKQGLTVDGVVGPATWSALGAAGAAGDEDDAPQACDADGAGDTPEAASCEDQPAQAAAAPAADDQGTSVGDVVTAVAGVALLGAFLFYQDPNSNT